jgi:hypothetical protein
MKVDLDDYESASRSFGVKVIFCSKTERAHLFFTTWVLKHWNIAEVLKIKGGNLSMNLYFYAAGTHRIIAEYFSVGGEQRIETVS